MPGARRQREKKAAGVRIANGSDGESPSEASRWLSLICAATVAASEGDEMSEYVQVWRAKVAAEDVVVAAEPSSPP